MTQSLFKRLLPPCPLSDYPRLLPSPSFPLQPPLKPFRRYDASGAIHAPTVRSWSVSLLLHPEKRLACRQLPAHPCPQVLNYRRHLDIRSGGKSTVNNKQKCAREPCKTSRFHRNSHSTLTLHQRTRCFLWILRPIVILHQWRSAAHNI
jgi:hypothetical protein